MRARVSLVNRYSCKICGHSSRSEIERLLVEGLSYRKIIARYPDLNLYNLNGHKGHLSTEQLASLDAPEITREEVAAAGQPDIVKIIENQVTEYELIKVKRQLTPQETLDRARYLEFLIKLRLNSLEAKEKAVADNSWIDIEIEKLRHAKQQESAN